jgi:hypothetical protein
MHRERAKINKDAKRNTKKETKKHIGTERNRRKGDGQIHRQLSPPSASSPPVTVFECAILLISLMLDTKIFLFWCPNIFRLLLDHCQLDIHI